MTQKNENEKKTKASVYMPQGEYSDFKIDTAKMEKAAGKHIKISDYLLGLIRLGKKAFTWGVSSYDWPDVQTIHEGGKPDRDWIREEFEVLKEKAGSPLNYQQLLVKRKKSNEEARRYLGLQRGVINEELDRVEHALEK